MYELLSKDLTEIGLEAMESAHCVFRGKGVIIVSYADYLLHMVEDEFTLTSIKSKLVNELPGNGMGLAVDVLGIKVVHGKGYS